MPLNTLRLNHAPSSHPNDRIVFIKPLARPPSQQDDYDTADLLLRAIAAQCLPVMRSNYLSVTTLEEHEPNPEFIGRNFNNGEIIQLVLRSSGGAWLSVRMIQMVMMHELAHNMQMNHSRKFWEVRNKFAAEMKELWSKGYTGDGLWGSGRVVGDLDGAMRQGNGVVGSEELKDLPLCGGTFRSRGRRRKRAGKQQFTWKERKQRRIEKKFGKHGETLGQDEDKRLRLEVLAKGPVGIKPRVAQSKRGRELRAAAAMARFATNQKEADQLEKTSQEDKEAESGTETGTDEETEYENSDDGQEDAKDVDGKILLDKNGHGMIRVCGYGDEHDDVSVKQELEELEGLTLDNIRSVDDAGQASASEQRLPGDRRMRSKDTQPKNHQTGQTDSLGSSSKTFHPRSSDESKSPNRTSKTSNIQSQLQLQPPPQSSSSTNGKAPLSTSTPPSTHTSHLDSLPSNLVEPRPQIQNCPICTTENLPSTITCTVCSHVLDPRKDPNHWRCASDICSRAGSQLINAGDCGVCGVCGEKRTVMPTTKVT